MNTTELFLKLTSETYPHGTESELEHLLPDNLKKDGYGNYYLEIGRNYTTMFTSHLDTASGSVAVGKKQPIIHNISKDGKTVTTIGNTILGADCKAGVVIMMNMIEHKIPGLYYFFLGEEVGCKGSRWLAKEMYKGTMFPGNDITKVISFDRRGTNSIITYQYNGRCASDEFADSLILEFKKTGMEMVKDPYGVCTDSIQFQDFIPECTNISVGYYSEHTSNEKQDLEFLEKISNSVIDINWESLVIKRDPSVIDYGNFYEEEEEEDYYHSSGYKSESKKTWSKDYTCYVTNPHTGEPTEVYISLERILYEKKILKDILLSWGFNKKLEMSDIDWNGKYLMVSWDGENKDAISRTDLSYSDNRLTQINSSDLMLIKDENSKYLSK